MGGGQTLSQPSSHSGYEPLMRRREPDAVRPFQAWGYPWAPGLFVVASFAMVVNEIIRNGLPALAGLAIIALGIPVYYLFARRRSQ